ncbi:MAG: hypothetical protein ACPL1B_03210 [Thermoprotei archaeon]|jgi:hypothetical protein
MKGFSEYFLILLMIIIIQYLFNYASATFCDNEFSSDVIWIYVASSINGKSSLTSEGYAYVNSGLRISSCIPPGIPFLSVKAFNDTFVYPFSARVGEDYTVIFHSPAGNYIGSAVTHNYCTGDVPESHVGCVAFLSGGCAV